MWGTKILMQAISNVYTAAGSPSLIYTLAINHQGMMAKKIKISLPDDPDFKTHYEMCILADRSP